MKRRKYDEEDIQDGKKEEGGEFVVVVEGRRNWEGKLESSSFISVPTPP